MQKVIDYITALPFLNVIAVCIFLELTVANTYLRRIWKETEYNNLEDDLSN